MDVKPPNGASVDLAGIQVARPFPAAVTIPTPGTLRQGDYTLLYRRKCVGPAPFVGDPRTTEAFYAWPVWTDDSGMHWISGDAELLLVDAL
jgi:hypothetical protein